MPHPFRRHLSARLRLEALENRSLPSASALAGIRASFDSKVIAAASAAFSSGLTPAQVRHAYGFDKLSYDGSGQTIAIVDAFDDPNIQSDLNTFSQAYGLATANFTKVNLAGKKTDAGWAGETALDVEWAHAIAPKAKILLVEAASDDLTDLLKAVDVARNTAGVSVVSLSWGSSEFRGETGYDSHFTSPSASHPVAFVASAGDDSAWSGATWPSVSNNVLAVGGTYLGVSSSGTYLGESAWSGGGGGYSYYEREASSQRSVQTTGWRTAPDVSYNADPNSGFAVYDSVPYQGYSGWQQIGGTSAGAPQWAALVALADQGRAASGLAAISNAATAVYSVPTADFHDVASGSNGYRAHAGYDLATGLGSPDASLIVPALVKGTTAATAAKAATASTATTSRTTNGNSFTFVFFPFAARLAADIPTAPAGNAASFNLFAVTTDAARFSPASSEAAASVTAAVTVSAPVVASAAPLTTVQVGSAHVLPDDGDDMLWDDGGE
jgi:subtilase family serine protease